MPESIIYVMFKDTVSDKSPNSIDVSVNNLAAQIIAAARMIEQNKNAIYDYTRQDIQLKEPKSSIPIMPCSIKSFPLSSGSAKPGDSEQEMINNVLKNLQKKTKKSLAIIRYLVQNSGLELTISQISEGTYICHSDLSIWFSTTGLKIKAITKPSRGTYRFNPDLLN